MALRRAASTMLEAEAKFRKVKGHQDLWMLTAALDEDRLLSNKSQQSLDKGQAAA